MWVSAFGKLLQARREVCLMCRQAADTRELGGLCAACYGRIPWILQVRCRVCGRAEACADCRRRRGSELFFARSRSAVSYNEQMKALLARYKYRGDERLAAVLGRMLYHAYRLHQAEESAEGDQEAVRLLSFVPVSERRLAERGFNQAEQMAAVLGERAGLPVLALLRRAKHTDKQSFKGRQARIGDLHGVFELNEQGVEELQTRYGASRSLVIYLIDDVYTTGSTMNQCAGVLKAGLHAVVYGLTWAR